MDSSVTLYLHHHGDFSPHPNSVYVGGKVEVIRDIDTDTLSFRDLDEFAEKYGYNPSDLVYFKNDGKTFGGGMRLMFDDATVRDMIEIHKPLGKIELFVDHYELDEVIDMPQKQQSNMNEAEVGNDQHSGTDSDDPEYMLETESEESESESLDLDFQESDDELITNRENMKLFKSSLNVPTSDAANHPFMSDESDYESDGLWSASSSSEDENHKIGYVGPSKQVKKRKKRRSRIDYGVRHDIIKWEVGMKFASLAEFRETVRQYAIQDRRGIQFVTNDPRRCQVCCEADCKFYIWCSKDKDSDNCTIKTLYSEHNCTKPYSNKLASVKYLAEVYGDRLRKNPQWKVKEMAETIKQEMEIEVPRIKILRVRKAALEGVHQSMKEHYSRLRDFANEVLVSNPKNTVKISTTRLNEGDPNKFKRIYLCYSALKEGWKAGCRPVIGLDGCFLKTICGGQLLSAVGRDGNNQMFPIAYAVVESENTDSWTWFTQLLTEDLDLGDGAEYTIISDQQKGLDNALKKILPRVEHRYCARHLYSNYRKRFSSLLLKRAFWNACMATHPAAHSRAMKELQRLSKPAYEQLSKLPPQVWTKAHFSTHCLADNVENNMSESFNAWIINERYMPLLTMLQEIHFKLLTRVRVNREAMMKNEHQLCPRIKKKLDTLISASRNWRASWNGATRYSVKQGTRVVTVDLDGRNCDCRVFDLTGIPCEHAIAAIYDRRHNPVDYVSEYYKKGKFLESYNHSLEALKGSEFWEIISTDELLPPDMPKKLRGRPKKLRRKEDWEGGNRSQATQEAGPSLQRYSNKRVMHCSICTQAGHRKSNCPNKKTATDEEAEMRRVEAGEHTNPEKSNVAEKPDVAQPLKKKPTRELRRQKLQIRRKSATTQDTVEEHGKVRNDGEVRDENVMKEKQDTPLTKSPGSGPLKVPRKHHPFVPEDEDVWDKTGRDPISFQERLRGPLGYHAVFKPTHGQLPFSPPRSTEAASRPVSNVQAKEVAAPLSTQQSTTSGDGKIAKGGTQESTSAGGSRRSTRLMLQTSFKFKNTKEDPVEL